MILLELRFDTSSRLLTEWVVVGKVELADLQEAAALRQTAHGRQKFLLGQRVEYEVHSSTVRLHHDELLERTVPRVADVTVLDLFKTDCYSTYIINATLTQ